MSVGPKLAAARKRTQEEVAARTVRTNDGFEYTPDLTRIPSGECDWHIVLWMAAALQELERLRAEVNK